MAFLCLKEGRLGLCWLSLVTQAISAQRLELSIPWDSRNCMWLIQRPGLQTKSRGLVILYPFSWRAFFVDMRTGFYRALYRIFNLPMLFRAMTENSGLLCLSDGGLPRGQGGFRDSNIRIAFVFGTERSGLTNEQVNQCQRCVGIPANPQCDSFEPCSNRPSYCLSTSNRSARTVIEQRKPSSAMRRTCVRWLYREKCSDICSRQWWHAGALDPQKPKFMMERFRHLLFSRAGLTQTEVDLLRGVYSFHHSFKDERKAVKL